MSALCNRSKAFSVTFSTEKFPFPCDMTSCIFFCLFVLFMNFLREVEKTHWWREGLFIAAITQVITGSNLIINGSKVSFFNSLILYCNHFRWLMKETRHLIVDSDFWTRLCVCVCVWSSVFLCWPAHLMLMQMSSRCAFMTLRTKPKYTRVKAEDEAASTTQGYTPQTAIHIAQQSTLRLSVTQHKQMRSTEQKQNKLHDTLKTRALCFTSHVRHMHTAWCERMWCFVVNVLNAFRQMSFSKWGRGSVWAV